MQATNLFCHIIKNFEGLNVRLSVLGLLFIFIITTVGVANADAETIIAKSQNVIVTASGFSFDGTKGNITPRDLFLEKVVEDHGSLNGNGLNLPLKELCNNASHSTGIIPAGRFAEFNISNNETYQAYNLTIPFGPYKANFLTRALINDAENIVINYTFDRENGSGKTYHKNQYSCWNYIMYNVQPLSWDGGSNARYLSISIAHFDGPSGYSPTDPDPGGWYEVPYSWSADSTENIKIDCRDGTLLIADPISTPAYNRPLKYIYSYRLNDTTFVKLVSNLPEWDRITSLVAETLHITASRTNVEASNESDPDYWYDKGSDFYRQYMYVAAIEAFRESLRLDSNRSETWHALGLALSYEENGKKYAEAADAFEHAIRLNPNDTISWCEEGVALAMQDRRNEAIPYYDEAIRLDPDYADAWRYKGIALYKLKKYEDAVNAFEEALNLNPYDGEAFDLKLKAEDKIRDGRIDE